MRRRGREGVRLSESESLCVCDRERERERERKREREDFHCKGILRDLHYNLSDHEFRCDT